MTDRNHVAGRAGRIALASLALSLLVVSLAACGGGGGENEQAETTPPTAAPDVYTVQGIIEKLPQADGPDRSVYIHHQAIPGYKNKDGEIVGMQSMTMPFPVGPDVSLEDIMPGDPVEFTFEMAWEPQGHYEITAIRELPPGTAVDFDDGEAGQDDHEGHEH